MHRLPNYDESTRTIDELTENDQNDATSSDDDDLESDPEECDSTNECDIPAQMSEPIYPGANITVLGAYCLLMEFKRLCKLPFSTLVTLLSVLQLLCPAENLLPTMKHQLVKFARQFPSQHSRMDFCRSYGAQLQQLTDRCPNPRCPKMETDSMIL